MIDHPIIRMALSGPIEKAPALIQAMPPNAVFAPGKIEGDQVLLASVTVRRSAGTVRSLRHLAVEFGFQVPGVYIEYESESALVADFRFESKMGGSVQFFADAASAGSEIVGYVWYFGDTDAEPPVPQSNEANPVHSFLPGNYTVRLVVTDESGNVASVEKVVTVPELTDPIEPAGGEE